VIQNGTTVNGISFPAGGVVPLDRGGVIKDPTIIMSEVYGHHEMIAGGHHSGPDIVGWMDEIPGMTAKVHEELTRRMQPQPMFATPAGFTVGAGESAELAAMRSELTQIRELVGVTAGNSARLPDIAGSTEAGALATQRLANNRPRRGRHPGAQL